MEMETCAAEQPSRSFLWAWGKERGRERKREKEGERESESKQEKERKRKGASNPSKIHGHGDPLGAVHEFDGPQVRVPQRAFLVATPGVQVALLCGHA